MVTQTDMRANFNEGRQLEGSLKVFKFPEVLQFLSMGKMSGALTLTHDGREARLVFSEGKIINVASGDRVSSLGQMLLSTGRIAKRALDEALETQERNPEKFIGEILLEKGLIDPAELQNAIRLQIEEELWEFFSWDSGYFKFEQGHMHDTGPVRVEMDVSSLLQEGVRRMEEWRVLCERISNPKEKLVPNPEFAGLTDQQLGEKTWRVLSLINGRLTIESLVRLSGIGKFETYYALDRLLHHEVVLRQPATMAEAAPAAESEARDGAEDSRQDQKREDAGKGRRGLFGRMKGGKTERGAEPEEEDAAIQVEAVYETDMALICAAVNHLIDLVSADPGARKEPGWVENLWRVIEQRHPRADFVRVRDNHFDTTLFERYAKLEGRVSRALAGPHDEGLEALRNFWSAALEMPGAGSRDPRGAQGLIDRASKPFINCKAAICNPDFSFMQWREQGYGA